MRTEPHEGACMKFSLATVVFTPRGGCFHGGSAHAGPDDWHRVFKWAAQTGFVGIEISPQWLNIDEMSSADLIDFRQGAQRAGLVVSGINVNRCLFTRDEGAGFALARMQRAIAVAAILQTRLVTFSLSLPLDSQRPLLHGYDIADAERDG